jgi:hypothetical protein
MGGQGAIPDKEGIMSFAKFVPSLAVVEAFGRHVPSYIAGAVTMAVGFAVVTPDQGHQIGDALTAIYNGVTSIAGGVSTLVAVGSGLYAGWTATHASQIKAVAAMPNVAKIVPIVNPDPTSAVAIAAKDHDQPKVG